MPKMKTNRAAAKRFQRTGSGKIRRRMSHGNHILTKKRPKRKRVLKQPALVHSANIKHVNKLLPYS
ncbi:MAG: 50S ribosomal protein L35 [Bradymonadales bacterium]|nr:50S ribosomal protein L35 [Bradymonadales bacterium]